MKLDLQVGALAPTIASQLKEQKVKVSAHVIEHWQMDVDAINRLRIRGMISERSAQVAVKKLVAHICKLAKGAPHG